MYFSEPVLFEVPVLPRIRKFMAVKLQDAAGHPQPFLASPACEGAGLMLWAMAQSPKVLLMTNWRRKKTASGATSAVRILVPEAMTEQIGLGIQEFHSSRHEHLLNYAELLVFSNFVDYIIQNELVLQCENNPDVSIMKNIKTFVDRYDFSENEMNERTLQQLYLRYRTGKSGFVFDQTVARMQHFQPIQIAA